jgi:hypothetical protein
MNSSPESIYNLLLECLINNPFSREKVASFPVRIIVVTIFFTDLIIYPYKYAIDSVWDILRRGLEHRL